MKETVRMEDLDIDDWEKRKRILKTKGWRIMCSSGSQRRQIT
jgi:hypothetical protein